MSGDENSPSRHFRANVLQHKVNGRSVFAVVFPHLEPDAYYSYRYYYPFGGKKLYQDCYSEATVYPGRVSIIDLRYRTDIDLLGNISSGYGMSL